MPGWHTGGVDSKAQHEQDKARFELGSVYYKDRCSHTQEQIATTTPFIRLPPSPGLPSVGMVVASP